MSGPAPPPAGREGRPRAAAPVGRHDVLSRLHRGVDDALARHGQLVLLAGEAGIGKTTMLSAAAAYAERRGARVAWGWGWPGAGAPGYWPWVQVLRTFGRDLPAPAGGAAPAFDRFALFDEVASLLLAEARSRPLAVLLDDLQWADESSLMLLDFLGRRLPAAAVAVIGSYRDVDPEPSGPLAELAARSTVLPLTGLDVGAVTRLVADVVGSSHAARVAAEVHRRTGGNPFFVEQVSWLLKADEAGLPPGVREALARRFGALPPGGATALHAGAVAGQRFAAELVAAATNQPLATVTDALRHAVLARLIADDGPGRYRFAHDLIREFAYEQAGSVTAAWHERIGLALEQGGQAPAAELARHFVRGRPTSAQARRYSVAAAREAAGRLAYEEAARHWEGALAATRDRDRAEVLLALGEARWRAGQGQASGEAYLQAAARAREAGDGRRLARAALGLAALGGRAWWPPGEVAALLSEALDALPAGAGERAQLRLRVMASLGRTLAWHGLDLPRARDLAAQAVQAAAATGDRATLAACLLAQHNAIWAPGTAAERLEIAVRAAGLAAGDRETELEARVLAAADRLELADPGFRAELEEFFRLAGLARQPRFRYAVLVRRAMLALLASQLAEASRLIGQATRLGEECEEPGARDVAYDQGWDLLAAQGRLGQLAGSLPEMFPDPDSDQARGSRALVLLAAGARGEAEQVAAPLLAAGYGAIPRNHQWLLGMAYAAEVVTALGDPAAASALYAGLRPYAGQAVVSGAAITFKGAVDHHLGVLAAAAGRPDEAAAHLKQAVAVHQRLGAAAWVLRSRYELARIRAGQEGRQAEAAAALTAVAAAAHRRGLAGLARDAEAAGFEAGRQPVTSGVFTRDGAVWTLAYGGVTVRMREAKGLADLAALLAVPGREVAAADLAAASGGGRFAAADLRLGADEVFDAAARRQIRARLAELAEDIAEAEGWNDPERAARARAERDAVLGQVTAAAGAHGRSRLLGDQSERARKAVTARIRDIISRIERVNPALAAHLRASVTTGTRCSYSPPAPVTWRL